MSEDVWLKTTCYGCPAATCGMLAHRVNGVVVEVAGDPESPYSQGRLCAKGQAQIMMAYSTRRVTKPLKRTNPEKGIGVDPQWVEISYDEAIRIAAAELKRCREKNPAGLVFSTADFSTLTWFTGALLGSFGSPNHASGGKVFCGNNVHPVLQQVHGGFHVQPDLHHCNYLMLFGSNKGAMSNWAAVSATIKMADARRRGMRLVVVDPWCSNAAAIADEWVPIRPGTDGAFVLAMLNVLVNEIDLFDRDFVARLTNGPYLVRDDDGHYARDPATNKPMMYDRRDGRAKCHDDPTLTEPALEGSFDVAGVACRPAFAKLKEHLAKYPPERVEEITTVPAATIRRIAREFGEAAAIGTTVDIEGHTLPLRPACAHWYKGVSQHARGYEQGMAIAMLNTLVGAVDVPGGLLSDAVYVHHPKFSAHSTWLGKGGSPGEFEGLLTPGGVATYGGVFAPPYPPREVKAPAGLSATALAPLGLNLWATAKVNVLHPEQFNHRIPHEPDVYVQVVSNDLVNEGSPKAQAEWHRKFRFHIAIVPVVDETAEFADIVFPTQTQLERLDMAANNSGDVLGTAVTDDYCLNLRQPVVESGYRHFVDIWSDLVEAVGYLPEYNRALNDRLELEGAFRLEPDRKYEHRELTDRWIRSMTGGEMTLAEVGRQGFLKWAKTVRERYPRPFFTARIPVYFEHFIEAGRRVKERADAMGIAWDVSRYVPLPDWVPSPGFADDTDGFAFHGVTYKWPFLTGTFSQFNPWLSELSRAHPYAGRIVINRKVAGSLGIADGDRVRVENRRGGQVEGIAKLSECIHPECLGMDHAGGHWARSQPHAKNGVHYGTLIEYEMSNIDNMNGALGASPKLRISRIEDPAQAARPRRW
ncbi:MAG: molybdopterin-dependent oxidoreductase [Steroidobacteraceae bacterium]